MWKSRLVIVAAVMWAGIAAWTGPSEARTVTLRWTAWLPSEKTYSATLYVNDSEYRRLRESWSEKSRLQTLEGDLRPYLRSSTEVGAELARQIRAQTQGYSDADRIHVALALACRFPYVLSPEVYAGEGLTTTSVYQYPIEYLVHQKGLCADRSIFAAWLLRRLGYDAYVVFLPPDLWRRFQEDTPAEFRSRLYGTGSVGHTVVCVACPTEDISGLQFYSKGKTFYVTDVSVEQGGWVGAAPEQWSEVEVWWGDTRSSAARVNTRYVPDAAPREEATAARREQRRVDGATGRDQNWNLLWKGEGTVSAGGSFYKSFDFEEHHPYSSSLSISIDWAGTRGYYPKVQIMGPNPYSGGLFLRAPNIDRSRTEADVYQWLQGLRVINRNVPYRLSDEIWRVAVFVKDIRFNRARTAIEWLRAYCEVYEAVERAAKAAPSTRSVREQTTRVQTSREQTPRRPEPLPLPGEGRVLRTSRPPGDARLGDVWVSPRDGKEMVYVPAGEFLMCESDQPRRVYLNGFWVDKHEVTVRQYRSFCQATGRKMPKAPSWERNDDHPIVDVSWHDAAAYVAWAGKRLPTEAEWEKAARGGDGRRYPWGNAEMNPYRHCSTYGSYDGYWHTAPVGSFPEGASPYGCLDMAGNVWEWCADWYDSDYYRSGPSRNPQGPSTGERRVARGGCYGMTDMRCANRNGMQPHRMNTRVGFRCARD